MVPRVSVIMSMYNCEKTLDRCIQSIIRQTYDSWEMIICDDGSTDRSYEKACEYSKMHSNITVLKNNQNMGSAYSRNRCIKAAKGEYIAVQDADDWSSEKRLEIQTTFLDTHPEYAFVGSCCYAVNNEGKIHEYKVPSKIEPLDLVPGGKFIHASFMMRKNILEEIGYYTVRKETTRNQDYHMVLKLYSKGYKLYNLQDFLYYYLLNDQTFKRCNRWRTVWGIMWIRFDGYKINKFPLWTYIFVLKPLFVKLIPKKIMHSHYRRLFFGKKKS